MHELGLIGSPKNNVLEILTKLGFCLACCTLAGHLVMDVAGNGAVGADWMGEHHKGKALHQGHILWMAWDHSLCPHFLNWASRLFSLVTSWLGPDLPGSIFPFCGKMGPVKSDHESLSAGPFEEGGFYMYWTFQLFPGWLIGPR